MDDIDRRLLHSLRQDASRPLKTLAAEVGLSRSSVRERIARLRAAGVIRRITVELRPEEHAVTALLLLRLERTPSPDIVRDITGRATVARCYSLSGPIDLMVEVSGASVAEINRTRDEVAAIPAIREVETSFVLSHDKAS